MPNISMFYGILNPMIIAKIQLESNRVLSVISEDGRTGTFDISPYLKYEAFEALRDINEFRKVSNGGYFVEWACGADLSADTIEAKWLLKTGSHNNRNKSLQRKSEPLDNKSNQ